MVNSPEELNALDAMATESPCARAPDCSLARRGLGAPRSNGRHHKRRSQLIPPAQAGREAHVAQPGTSPESSMSTSVGRREDLSLKSRLEASFTFGDVVIQSDFDVQDKRIVITLRTSHAT